jgi:hypothetical protein
VKRGLIAWDKSEIPPEIFHRRVEGMRRVLAERDLPAAVVYSDLWRSSHARFFSNFMPYFNRALLIVPRDVPATLLCGLSPRVYGWIRSVTTIEDVRPAGNFAKPLFELASERKWSRLGVVDLDQLPYDIYKALQSGAVALAAIESSAVVSLGADASERALRQKTAALADEILKEEMPNAVGIVDHEFVGNLERRFRRAGAEDLIVLVTNGETVPAPPTGAPLQPDFSVSLAVEYRGHWIRMSRTQGGATPFEPGLMERLDGSYPYECGTGGGKLTAAHSEYNRNGKRLFHGDTVL